MAPIAPISYTTSSREVHELVNLYQNGKLNLSPGFQRQSVWSQRDRMKLIDSILRRYPLPAIFLYRRETEGQIVLDVIDGKQRLESIFSFMGVMRGRRFELKTTFPGDDEPEVWDWPRLVRRKRQAPIEGYKVTVIQVDGELGDMIDLFVRINSTGKALSAQERRHARYFNSPFLKGIGRAAESTALLLKGQHVLSDAQIARMKHVELMAELAYSIHSGEVIHKKAALDRVMSDHAMTPLRVRKAVDGAKAAVRRTIKLFPDLRTTRFRQLADFYTLVVLLAKFERDGFVLTDTRRNAIAWELLSKFGAGIDALRVKQKQMTKASQADDDMRAYLLTVTEGTDSETNRRNRERILRGLLGSVFEKKDTKRLFSEEQRRLIWHSAGKPKCMACRCNLTWRDFHIDHVFAHSKGGRTALENAQLLCAPCNTKKGNR
jgi:hypothetical protein